MRVLTVRFKSAASARELEAPFRELAPAVAAVPGLLSKTWIQDGDLFGGLYIFKDQASVDGFAASQMVVDIMGNPAFSDFRLEQYDVLEELSAVTRGLPAVVARWRPAPCPTEPFASGRLTLLPVLPEQAVE